MGWDGMPENRDAFIEFLIILACNIYCHQASQKLYSQYACHLQENPGVLFDHQGVQRSETLMKNFVSRA